MFKLFKKDPTKKLEAQYARKLEAALDAQRRGKMPLFATLTAEAEEIGHDGDDPGGRAPLQESQSRRSKLQERLEDQIVVGAHEGVPSLLTNLAVELRPDLPPVLHDLRQRRTLGSVEARWGRVGHESSLLRAVIGRLGLYSSP